MTYSSAAVVIVITFKCFTTLFHNVNAAFYLFIQLWNGHYACCHFWLCAVVIQQCHLAHFDEFVFVYMSLDALRDIS